MAMTLEEMGATLRAEREKCRLSIEDVASDLKINARVLTALENGDMQSLPHPAYVRGFIRSYAKAVGISPEEVQDWLAGLDGKSAPRRKEKEELDLPKPESQKKNGKGLVVLAIACALAGAAWWAWSQGLIPVDKLLQGKRSEPEAQSSLPRTYAAGNQERPSPVLPKKEPVSQPSPTQPVEAKPVQRADLGLPPETVPAKSEAAAAVAPEPAKPIEPAAREQEPAAPTQHKLLITATEECWVHSSADKTDTRQFSLRKGDTFALTFSKSLELKLGNAGGVRLRYDGKDLPPAGTSGQVKTVTFPPDN